VSFKNDFAELLGIAKQYLCELEKGRRFVSPKAVAEFAAILQSTFLSFSFMTCNKIVLI